MGELRVRYDEGTAAVDRTSRGVVLLTMNALQHLRELGWVRGRHTAIKVHPDGMPVWVMLRDEPAFMIDFELDEKSLKTMGLTVVGRWIFHPPRRSWIVRAFWRVVTWIRRKDA